MSQPFVTTDIHESLDIHGHLAAQATFDLIAGFDDGAQAVDLVFSQTVYAHLWTDTSLFDYAVGNRVTDAKYIGQTYRDPLVAG